MKLISKTNTESQTLFTALVSGPIRAQHDQCWVLIGPDTEAGSCNQTSVLVYREITKQNLNEIIQFTKKILNFRVGKTFTQPSLHTNRGEETFDEFVKYFSIF